MNFDHPYLSRSIREFWRRWHISLSTWFRDYVYIPLGGSRRGLFYGWFALISTMLLSGIWHGANYTFIVWAALHVLYMLVERHTRWTAHLKHVPALVLLIVFLQVTLAWVFFRAESMDQALEITQRLFAFEASDWGFFDAYYNSIFFLVAGILIEAGFYMSRTFPVVSRFHRTYHTDVWAMAISLAAILFFRGEGQQFIYFQF